MLQLSSAFGQSEVFPLGQRSFQDALLLERKGDLEDAQQLYVSILIENPKNRQAYNRLKNIYIHQRNYVEAAEIISNWLLHSPHDQQQRVELGEIFYINGNTEQAVLVWDNFIANYGHNASAYRMLIYTYNKLGLAEVMAELVQAARLKFNDPTFMALDLGNFYQSRQQTAKAVVELLLYAEYNLNQQKLVEDKIMVMSDNEDNGVIIEATLQEYLQHNADLIHNLLAALYFKTGRYQLSLDHQMAISRTTGDQWNRLNTFADNLRKEQQYDLAIKTYRTLLEEVDNQSDDLDTKAVGSILLGLGKVYEDQILPHQISNSLILNEVNNVFFSSDFYQHSTISTVALEQALSLYNAILRDLESTSFSPRAHFRLGEIQFNILQDIDGARSAFTAALRTKPKPELEFIIHSRLVDIYLVEGDMVNAQNYFTNLPRRLRNSFQNEIAIKTMQIFLYNHAVDTTIAILDQILANMTPKQIQFNDFMELQAFLNIHYANGNDSNKEAFHLYLTGEKLLVQNKLAEAVEVFNQIRSAFPETSIAPTAAVREVFTLLNLNHREQSLPALEWLINSEAGDKGLLLSGEINDYFLENDAAALDYYELFLQDYPQSFLYEPVRQRVRGLKAELES